MKALFVGCHTDDIELNCGATLSKMIREGHDVECVILSWCANPPLIDELGKSMSALGVTNYTLYDFPVRRFSEYRQEILDALLKHKVHDVVFCHSPYDRHQDHSMCGTEVIRAYPRSSIYCYCHPFNTVSMSEQAFIQVSEYDLERKKTALSLYESQSHRTYMQPEQIESLCKVRGVQSGFEYAEAFEVKRLIGLPMP